MLLLNDEKKSFYISTQNKSATTKLKFIVHMRGYSCCRIKFRLCSLPESFYNDFVNVQLNVQGIYSYPIFENRYLNLMKTTFEI